MQPNDTLPPPLIQQFEDELNVQFGGILALKERYGDLIYTGVTRLADAIRNNQLATFASEVQEVKMYRVCRRLPSGMRWESFFAPPF